MLVVRQHPHQQQSGDISMTAEAVNWDDFSSGGDFVKFENVGDTVTGTITAIRGGTDFNGNPCPVIDLDTADGARTVTCAQANLKAQIVAKRPTVGSSITITYAKQTKVEKGMRKDFDIVITAGEAKPPF
jgi:hypothetical protein